MPRRITRLRNRLGHELAEYHRLLPRFVAFLDDAGLQTVTVAAALAWVNAPDVDPSGTVASHRMTIARGFARHMAGLDPRTEIPPFGLVGSRRHRHEPFIFSPGDIAALMTGAQSLRTRFASATHETVIGLLAATGMRVGEAIRLDRGDIAETDATLTIRESKFGKSRLVPLQPSVLAALQRYARLRDEVHREPTTVSFLRLDSGQQDGLSHDPRGVPKPLRQRRNRSLSDLAAANSRSAPHIRGSDIARLVSGRRRRRRPAAGAVDLSRASRPSYGDRKFVTVSPRFCNVSSSDRSAS